jgi:hypothetical protein
MVATQGDAKKALEVTSAATNTLNAPPGNLLGGVLGT